MRHGKKQILTPALDFFFARRLHPVQLGEVVQRKDLNEHFGLS